MTVAIAYLRCSTDDQKLSPEVQQRAIEDFAKREGIEVAGFYTDVGISGAAPIDERPALQAALLAMREHKAQVFLVAKRDRLARDVLIATVVERSLPKGAVLLSADGSGNGSTPADALLRTILDGMASYERALIRSRTKAALQAKKSKGERVGTVPFGYRTDPNSSVLVEDEAEQIIIREILSLDADGWSRRTIRGLLSERGVVGRTGKALGLTQIHNVIHTARQRMVA